MIAALSVPAVSAHHAQPNINRTFSLRVGELINNTMSLMDESKFESACAELSDALDYSQSTADVPKFSPYERSILLLIRGSCAYELGKIEAAIRSFEMAINNGGLNGPEISQTKYNLVQLYIAEDQYVLALRTLDNLRRENYPLGDDDLRLLETLQYLIKPN